MIEPTETFEKEELVEAVREVCREAQTSPEKVLKAPYNTAVSRIDEIKASHPQTMALSWRIYLKRRAEAKP
jgi:glycine dehydrogenase subunit 2